MPRYMILLTLGAIFSFVFFATMTSEGQPQELPVAVVDLDGTYLSRRLCHELDATQAVHVKAVYQNHNEARQAMQRGEIPLQNGIDFEDLPDAIAEYAEAVRTAPDENELRLASTSFVDKSYLAEMNGWGTVDGKEVHLDVIHWGDDNFDKAAYFVSSYGDWNNSYSIPSAHVEDDLPRDRVFPSFSEEEALQMGDALMDELDLGDVKCDLIEPVFFFNYAYYYSEEEHGGWADMDPDALIEDTGYRLRYMRCVNGFPISWTPYAGSAVEHEADHDAFWSYEKMEVCVTADGVVYFSWESPYNEPTVELEDTQLMSFDEIASIFERMFMVKYSYIQTVNDNGGDAHPNIQINRVRLNLMRIKAKNSSDTGLLVPVWDFYGTEFYQRDGVDVPLEETIVLTINAIDGSMIDRELGY